jgi:hypothetical protein
VPKHFAKENETKLTESKGGPEQEASFSSKKYL